MRFRVLLAKFLLRLGYFIRSLPVIVMRPNDLVKFSRQHYSQKGLSYWCREDVIDKGLDQDEIELLEKIPVKEGKILVLGIGGGREAIYLAGKGFSVTGLDYIPEMVTKACSNASKRGLKINGLVQDCSQLSVPNDFYDIVWISAAMYSSIPTRKRRIKMLDKIRDALKPGGYFLCQFKWDAKKKIVPAAERIRKAIAFLTLGNCLYETGDTLWSDVEFIHSFYKESDIRKEFKAGGFEIADISFYEKKVRGGAILRKI